MSNKVTREFTTKQGDQIELVGPSRMVQVWINGALYMHVSGLRAARRVAIRYSLRHAA